MSALQQIPSIIDGAQRVTRLYRDSQRLELLSRAFYTSIMAALGHIMHYLRKKASRRLPNVVFKPSSFEEQLVQKIDAIASDKDAFNEEADICHKEMVDRMSSTAEDRGERTEEDLHIMREVMCVAIREQRRTTLEQRMANQGIDEKLDKLERKQSDIGRATMSISSALEPLLRLWASGDPMRAYSFDMGWFRHLKSPQRLDAG
ncbi:hypothetical protein IMZ48_36305 [Candidatus Bathyarchaeota archaeon]|nr:hypothetical protein [Candidatus Bathyarchaeota archaeon]